MTTSVFGIASNDQHASRIARRLKAAGFADSDVSVLFADQTGVRDLAHEKSTKAPEGATGGATAGAVIGGAVGWLAGIGLLAIPGVGPMIAAGPIMAALSGAAIGGGTGGIAGALMGLGAPEYEAKQYEGKLKKGNVLLSIHTRDSAEASRAKEILKDEKAEDISSASEAAAAR